MSLYCSQIVTLFDEVKVKYDDVDQAKLLKLCTEFIKAVFEGSEEISEPDKKVNSYDYSMKLYSRYTHSRKDPLQLLYLCIKFDEQCTDLRDNDVNNKEDKEFDEEDLKILNSFLTRQFGMVLYLDKVKSAMDKLLEGVFRYDYDYESFSWMVVKYIIENDHDEIFKNRCSDFEEEQLRLSNFVIDLFNNEFSKYKYNTQEYMGFYP
jgi:hypothetical protein